MLLAEKLDRINRLKKEIAKQSKYIDLLESKDCRADLRDEYDYLYDLCNELEELENE